MESESSRELNKITAKKQVLLLINDMRDRFSSVCYLSKLDFIRRYHLKKLIKLVITQFVLLSTMDWISILCFRLIDM